MHLYRGHAQAFLEREVTSRESACIAWLKSVASCVCAIGGVEYSRKDMVTRDKTGMCGGC